MPTTSSPSRIARRSHGRPRRAVEHTPSRAIGIVRVSHVKGRDRRSGGDGFASPEQQRERIEEECQRAGLRLLRVADEMDVSGKTPLEERTGLREAIEAVEAGKADTIVAAYFDRLVRSLRVQAEVVQRVELAGGKVLAVDVGQVTEGTASQWLSGTMHGMVAEYHARASAERAGAAQARAVEQGRWPCPRIPVGYKRAADGTLEVVPRDARHVVQAFAMRARGETIEAVRGYLLKHGHEYTYAGVAALLKNRTYLGEIVFGRLHNPAAHPAIVPPDVFAAVQRTSPPRGPNGKSDRLLARLGVLRCASCGGRMSVSSQKRGSYYEYRCPGTSDCDSKASIGAARIERHVVDHVRRLYADVEGRAKKLTDARDAEQALQRTQDALDAAIRTLADFTDEPATRERLKALRDERDAARERLERYSGVGESTLSVNLAKDWDRLTLAERRAVIAATIARIEVAKGTGLERITITDA